MKMNKEYGLFSVLTGSHLYGNATVSSDFDYKVVCLPALDDLLMCKRIVNKKEKPEGMSQQDSMRPGDTETEYLPLQVFLDDFLNGQTYALEIAFAAAQELHTIPEGTPLEGGVHAFWAKTMQEMISLFLTKNVKKMVGYAVSQSKLYGLKTQRYTSIKAVLDIINDSFNSTSTDEKEIQKLKETLRISDTPTLVNNLLKLEHIKMSEVKNGNVTQALEIAGKLYPISTKWDTVITSVSGVLDKYGERVKKFEGENVDWKALSHAIRITEQVLELCDTGELQFPRKNAQYLSHVKRGLIELEDALQYLQDVFSKIDEATERSTLPELSNELKDEFNKWKLNLLKSIYQLH